MPPVVLCILDGWGLSEDKTSNAPVLAKTPNFDHLWKTCPKTTLLTHGQESCPCVKSVVFGQVFHK